MMHGYMAFDKNDKPLVPFRTWRNTMTAQAAGELTNYWDSISHSVGASLIFIRRCLTKKPMFLISLISIPLQDMCIKRLTDRFEVGVGEASGIFLWRA